jgi:hypothetical protein
MASMQPPRLLDRVRAAARLRHYSRRTERAYVGWIRRFVLFHGKRHPAEMGSAEITAFLSWLATEGQGPRRRRTGRSGCCCSLLFQRLTTMPGISETMARLIVAEIGTEMRRFPTAGHLVSWAALCPGLHESAGKRRSTRTPPGALWLKTNVVQAAWGAVRTRNSYFRAQFVRVKSRRGSKKAIVAVAASMLTAAYSMLRDDVPYRDLSADHFDRRDKAKLTPPPRRPRPRSRPAGRSAPGGLTNVELPSRRSPL